MIRARGAYLSMNGSKRDAQSVTLDTNVRYSFKTNPQQIGQLAPNSTQAKSSNNFKAFLRNHMSKKA